MKNIKSIWYLRMAVVLAIAFCASACLKEDIIAIADPMPQGKMIRFNIERGWDDEDAITRSGASEYGVSKSKHILVSEDKTESLEMDVYQQANGNWFETETKGTMVQASQFNEFMAFGYKTKNNTTETMFTTYHKKGDDMWETPEQENSEEGYYWPGSEYTCSFFGIAMSDNKLTNESFYNNVKTTTNDAGQIISFDYTVPDAAIDQPDIMVASATNLAGDGSEGATLNFKHILTAINIKVGTVTGDNISSITVSSITFNNIYAKASYTLATEAWTNATYYNTQKSFNVDFNGSASGNGSHTFQSGSGAIMNGTAATLMMLPQSLRNDATITVKYKINRTSGTSSDTITSTANIGGSVWEPGKAINYILNIDNNDGVEFLTQDTYVDAHYVILPLNIKYQNTSEGLGDVTLRAWDKATNAAATWVQFRKTLVEVENDGWWADPSQIYEVDNSGEQTPVRTNPYSRSASLDITQPGQYFAFLTENLGDVDRNVALQLVVNGTVEDEILISQFCPTWSGTKGCERIEEGESLPWGYSWILKEGQSDYKVTVKFKGGYGARIWAALIRFIFSRDVDFDSGGIFSDTDTYIFDYSEFIKDMTENTGAGSTDNGLQNTAYMYNYDSSSGMLAFQEWLNENYPNEVANGGTSASFEGISYTEYATKEALKKNKIKVLIGNEIHSPAIDGSRTDLWYLPATGEVDILQNNVNMINGVETPMNNGNIFWTSTAAETPNAYIYTFGSGTSLEDRDNAHRVRAIRNKSN